VTVQLLGSLLVLLALAACGGAEAAEREAHRTRAKALVLELAGNLQAELKAAIERGGPEEAIAVCSEKVPEIAAAAARDGYRVRRIGTRVRNKKSNVPSEHERLVLEEFAAIPEGEREGVSRDEVLPSGAADWLYYAPIYVSKPVCLTCHGPVEQIPERVRQALAEKYPDDEATGYALGDLRGAFVVEYVEPGR
jgi:hypothetical protein